VERSSGAAPPLNQGAGGPEKLPPFTVRIETSAGRSSVVALSGELDLSTIPSMESALLEQITQRSAVLVDLTGLSFIDSSGIGVLIRAFRESNGNPMHVLVGPGSQVERVFQIAGIADAMPVFSDRELAVAALLNGDGRPAAGS
jgi:anti-sigma B factor antagonist